MRCEKCGFKLKVLRTETIGNGVYRVRWCKKCDNMFQTAESKWSPFKKKNATLTPTLSSGEGDGGSDA